MEKLPMSARKTTNRRGTKPSDGGVNFFIRSGLDASTIHPAMDRLCTILRETLERKDGVPIFTGRQEDRDTPRGPKSTAKGSRVTATTEPRSRFLTFSTEIRQLIITMISFTYTEIFISITYLHNRAFELDKLLNKGAKLRELLANPDPERDEAAELKSWIDDAILFHKRNPSLSEDVDRIITNLESVVDAGNRERKVNRVVCEIARLFGIQRPNKSSLVLTTVDDVILFQQEDFEYHTGASWVDILQTRRGQGNGRDSIRSDLNQGDLADLDKHDSDMIEAFKKDIHANLVSTVNNPKIGFGDSVTLCSEFINELASLLSNFIIDISICSFKFATGRTNNVVGTTIQHQSLKTIMSQWNFNTIYPIPVAIRSLMQETVIKIIESSKSTHKSSSKDDGTDG